MSDWNNFLKTTLSKKEIENIHKNALKITHYNDITLELEELYNYIAPKSRIIRFYNKIAYKAFYKNDFENESEVFDILKELYTFFRMLNKVIPNDENTDFSASIEYLYNNNYENILNLIKNSDFTIYLIFVFKQVIFCYLFEFFLLSASNEKRLK